MPRRTRGPAPRPRRLFDAVLDQILQMQRQDLIPEVIYLNPTDLNVMTQEASCQLLGVRITGSIAVPLGHMCLKSHLDEIRHISRNDCIPL